MEDDASKATVSGVVPLTALAVRTACNATDGAMAAVKEKGAEWGLSVPSLKAAVRVKLVVAALRVTWQSIDVAAGSWVWHANTPS